MSLSAIIVDDEQLARDELDFLLKSTGDVEVLAHGRNGLDAVQLVKEHSPDLLFLDVQMPGLDGFGAIKKLIAAKLQLPMIVFATAFDEYAVKAFEVNALDYLLKPYDKKRIAQAVHKAKHFAELHDAASESEPASGDNNDDKLSALLRMLESQQHTKSPHAPTKILLRNNGRMFLVDQREICYASIDDGVITVVTNQMEGESNARTLEELQEMLHPGLFWRAHRGYLVNINRIREVVPWFKSSYQLRMDDRKQTEIPVSRAQTKRLRELFKL
jgi:two-component system LytT family response regulator/two-component system response regulator LytT